MVLMVSGDIWWRWSLEASPLLPETGASGWIRCRLLVVKWLLPLLRPSRALGFAYVGAGSGGGVGVLLGRF